MMHVALLLGLLVEDQIRAALPPSLALVSIQAPDLPAPTVVWHGAPHPGIMTVEVVSGATRRWARIELRAVARVLVARRPLSAGAHVAAGDLALEERPVQGRALEIDPDFLVGAAVAHPVAAGASLSAADLVLPPPVPRGTEVRVIVRAGAAQVATRGVLERPARPGEATAARVDNRLISGRLVDAQTVEVTR